MLRATPGEPKADAARGVTLVTENEVCELDQHSIAGCLDDAPAVLGNLGFQQDVSQLLQQSHRALLVLTHQTAVASDISRQYRRESPVYMLHRQGASPNWATFRGRL